MIQYRKGTQYDLNGILEVALDLPEWFNDDARNRAIPIDVKHHRTFIALDNENVIAFITLFVNEGRLNIGWLGVKKIFQRQGIGSQLIHLTEVLAKELACHEIAAKTLGDSVDYAPYETTRQFYFNQGFKVNMKSRTDNTGCPEEFHIVKRLK